MIRNEVSRVIRIATMNPLTKEEWMRIKELLDKNELSLEEALKLRELAKRVVDECSDRLEAWKLHIYAFIMVGLTYKKLREQQEKKGC